MGYPSSGHNGYAHVDGRGGNGRNGGGNGWNNNNYQNNQNKSLTSFRDQNSSGYELADVNPYATGSSLAAGNGASTGANSEEMISFFAEVDDIKRSLVQYDDNVDRVESLHRKSLNEVGVEEQEFTQRQIEGMVRDTSALADTIKSRIRSLQSRAQKDATRKSHVDNVKRQFMESIQRFQSMEASFRQQYKDVAERQYRIVNPEASEAEVHEAIESSNTQIFSQALMSSNRRGQARTALSEVQARHREIQKIEKTMQELAQLFHDMETLVAEQEEPVRHIDEQATQVQQDIEQGVAHTNRAIISARALRKKKWWCIFIIFIIVCIVVAVPVGVVVGGRN